MRRYRCLEELSIEFDAGTGESNRYREGGGSTYFIRKKRFNDRDSTRLTLGFCILTSTNCTIYFLIGTKDKSSFISPKRFNVLKIDGQYEMKSLCRIMYFTVI